MEVSFRGLPRQHITDSSSLSLNDHISKMPERESWSCGVPVKLGLWQPKVKSILRGCSGFTGNSLPLNVPGYIKASPAADFNCSNKSVVWWLLKAEAFCWLHCALSFSGGNVTYSHPAQTTGGAEHWDPWYPCGKAPCSVKELFGSPSGWSKPLHLSLQYNTCPTLCFMLKTSIWWRITMILSASCRELGSLKQWSSSKW